MPSPTPTTTGGSATWLLTPRPTSGAIACALERPACALHAHAVARPVHRQHGERRCRPGGRARPCPARGRTCNWSLPHHASSDVTAASTGAPSAPRAATAWSRRSPWPARSSSRLGRQRGGVGDRQLGVRGPLVDRVADDLGVLRRPRQSDRRDRVEVADEDARLEAGGAGVIEAAIGGDDGGVARDGGDGAAVERRCTGDHDDGVVGHAFPPPALPGSGSRVGGGNRPLSPLVR